MEPCTRKHDFRILSVDPGTRNFGIACVGVRGNKVDIIANAVLTNPMYNIADNFPMQKKLFLDEIGMWLAMYKPDAIIGERFMTRGLGGPLIEIVSMMNGMLSMLIPDAPFKVISASTWKNKWNRRFKTQLDQMYKRVRTTPHQLDAGLIGCYGFEVALQRQLSYSPKTIRLMIESSSRLPLKRSKK